MAGFTQNEINNVDMYYIFLVSASELNDKGDNISRFKNTPLYCCYIENGTVRSKKVFGTGAIKGPEAAFAKLEVNDIPAGYITIDISEKDGQRIRNEILLFILKIMAGNIKSFTLADIVSVFTDSRVITGQSWKNTLARWIREEYNILAKDPRIYNYIAKTKSGYGFKTVDKYWRIKLRRGIQELFKDIYRGVQLYLRY